MRDTALFSRVRLIRFSDCDPAGIVFYPQYFVMCNDLVEDWFDHGLKLGYERTIIQRRIGLPTVHLEVDFKAFSPMGDYVVLSRVVERLGTKSLTLQLRVHGKASQQLRLQMRQVLVTTSLEDHRAIEIPPDIRRSVEAAIAARAASAPAGQGA
jgi:4-hydroxybenzoyl-CoA thioesterase